MKHLLTIPGVWLGGVALSLAMAILVNLITGAGFVDLNQLALTRWVHVIAGIIWVGLLYFFNFVQMPAVAAAIAEQSGAQAGPGPSAIARYVAPRALLWFRYAALVTWLAGCWYLVQTGLLVKVFSLGLVGSGSGTYGLTMGLGAWLGTILLINVWFVIWPNQKLILGLVPIANDAALVSAKQRVATFARINAILSLPMLMFMIAAGHGLPF